ncbi:Coronin-2B [Rhizophlyctis rosea]|nr:Coronin-2B [Rhizophlyctis rosea]
MMDVVFEHTPPKPGVAVTIVGEDGVAEEVELSPVRETIKMDRKVSSTVGRKSSMAPKHHGGRGDTTGGGGLAVPDFGHAKEGSEDSHSLTLTHAIYLDGFMELERRGWLGSVWERRYLSLKRTRLYISADEQAETPLASLSIADIKHVDTFSTGKDAKGLSLELGFSIDTGDIIYRFKASSQSERDHWVHTLNSFHKHGHGPISRSPSMDISNSPRSSVSSTYVTGRPSHTSTSAPLPPLPRAPPPLTRTSATLIGELQTLTQPPDIRKPPQYTPRFIVLDEDAMLHTYINDIKAYTSGKPPLESMNLTAAISVRLVGEGDLAQPGEAEGAGGGQGGTKVTESTTQTEFIINTTKRAVIFRARNAYEAANWVMQIRRVVVAKAVLPSSEVIGSSVVEGWVELLRISDAAGKPVAASASPTFTGLTGKCWVSIIDGAFYYFRSPTSTTPIHIIQSTQFEDVAVPNPKTPAPGHEDLSRCFNLLVKEPSQTTVTTILHSVETSHIAAKWIESLTQIRMASFDLLGKLGITSDEALRNDIILAKGSEALVEPSEGVQLVDENEKAVSAMGFVRLYRVQEAQQRRKRVKLVYEGIAPSKAILESDGCYVLWSGREVFLWVGGKSSVEVRAVGAVIVRRLVKDIQREETVFAQRMSEGSESVVWKEKFIDYEGSLPISMRMTETPKSFTAPTIAQPPILIPPLLTRLPHPQSSLVLLDNPSSISSSSYQLFRIDNFQRYAVPDDLHGQFFRGESYVLVYKYRPQGSGVDRAMIYFWQGSRSGNLDRGTSAHMAVELSEGVSGEVVQCRIVEGREPKHFSSPVTGSTIAFDIRECFEGVCKASECELNEIQLTQTHVVLLLTPTHSFLYSGKFSLPSEQSYAKGVAARFGAHKAALTTLGPTATLPEDFSSLLSPDALAEHTTTSGKGRYLPRLFSCSSGSGVVKIEEIVGFTQEDLDPNIAMILDIESKVFVWFGITSKPNEKLLAMETVEKYVAASSQHDKDKTERLVTYAYQEPYDFIKCFQAWTRKKIPKDKVALKPRIRPLSEVLAEYKRETYPIDVLLGDADKVPEHLDRTKLEMYLSEDDFESLFKMRKEEYLAMQPWKRDKIKKDLGVF